MMNVSNDGTAKTGESRFKDTIIASGSHLRGVHIVHPTAFRYKQIEMNVDNASAGNLAKAFFRRLFLQINKKPPGK